LLSPFLFAIRTAFLRDIEVLIANRLSNKLGPAVYHSAGVATPWPGFDGLGAANHIHKVPAIETRAIIGKF
jgi:hypothetical protein